MKERILRLIEMEQLSPSKFADLIGVQRSSVSHVLSGRNNPSFDFIEKTLRSFPGLKADWLILGEGPMYLQMGRSDTGSLFDEDRMDALDSERPAQEKETEGSVDEPGKIIEKDKEEAASKEEVQKESVSGSEIAQERKIRQVFIFYDDGTFSSYNPSGSDPYDQGAD